MEIKNDLTPFFFGFHVICIDFDLYEVRVLVLFVHNLALSKPILREV